MSSKRIVDYTADTTPATGDFIVTVDISDTTDASDGTNKKVTLANLFAQFISDTAYAGSWDGVTTIAPSKNAVYDQIQLMAPLASPTLTGTPAAPTAAADTNTTQIATTAFVLAQAASQAEQETSTSTTKFITPGRQQFHPSAAKFWTITGIAGNALASYNVTSIGDTGTGIMTVTIATDFSSANWAPVYMGISNGRTVTLATMQWVSAAMAAGTIEITNSDLSATPIVEDPAVGYSVAGFGDQ